MQITKKRLFFTITSIMVTVGIFSYLLKYISPGEVVQIIKGVDGAALLMFLVLSFSMSFFRTWRYQVLLKLSGLKQHPFVLFLVVLVRNFFSDLLPARIGTLIYIFIVNTRLGIPLGPATSSFSLAFLFDILAVVPLIILASLAAAYKAKIFFFPLLIGGAVIGVITIILIFLLPTLFSFFRGLLLKLPLLKEDAKIELSKIAASVEEEILKAKNAGLYTPVLVLSFLVRIAKYGSLYVFLYALLHSMGYQWSDLHIPSIFLGLSAAEFAASLPISGIAAFGAYEGTWAMVFQLIGFSDHVAKLTAISHHLFTQVYGYLIGAVALVILMLPMFKNRGRYSRSENDLIESKSIFYLKVTASSLVIMVGLFGLSRLTF